MSPDPEALPRFKFAVLAIGDTGIEVITRSLEQQILVADVARAEPAGHVFYTENVLQNYTVQVPYIEKVNGVSITKVRAETRTRTVPVQRLRKMTEDELAVEKAKKEKEQGKVEVDKKSVAKRQVVTIPYTVDVPYAATDDNGNKVTRIRKEKKTRSEYVFRGETETTFESDSKSYDFDSVEF